MADDPRNPSEDVVPLLDPAHELPAPPGQRGAVLGEQFANISAADRAHLAQSFADPNSLDDGRLGKSFIDTNSAHKRKHGDRKPHAKENHSTLWIFICAALIVAVVAFLIGWLPRHHREKQIDAGAKNEQSARPVVFVTQLQRAVDRTGVVIPGTTAPIEEAFVYARANGYLKKRLVDIGDHVRKDQLLAVIESPDLDQQVDQAREQVKQAQAQLAQQKSQLALATLTVERYRVLVAKGVFSRQEGDQQEANYAAQQANVAAAERNVEAFEANLHRVQALQSYEYVRAPFAGVVTQRNVDVGALISAAGATSGAAAGPAPTGQNSSSGGSQQPGQSNSSGASGSVNSAATPAQSPGQGGPLFGIAQDDTLRVLVSVPESYATSIHVGTKAQLNFDEYPQHSFTGTVTRNADTVDQNTRTMLTEVDVDNREHKLVAGMYTVVTFPPAPGYAPLLVPGDAVAIRSDQPVVAVIRNGTVHLQPVTLGRDFGTVIEVVNGLQAGDLIATNVTDDVTEGAQVTARQDKTSQAAPPQEPPQNQPVGGDSQYGNQGVTDQNLQNRQSQQNKQGKGGRAQKPASAGSKP
jgi:multidrug efflux pump subunit AcrA (membrane-fusion protein)